MASTGLRPGLLWLLTAVLAGPVPAQEPPLVREQVWRHGIALLEEPQLPEGFSHFPYADPDAPKGGLLRLSQTGTFDSFNPVLARGEIAPGIARVFDTLLKPSTAEVSGAYGLLAEAVSYPQDFSETTFRLRAGATFSDGAPVTPADVIFSFESLKEHHPLYASYYRHVTEAVQTGERDVTFRFDEKNNRELPHILGQFSILPKHWWESQGPDGRPRDISRTTLEPVIGSGPYRIAGFSAGLSVRYELRDDYWGRDLPVNRGQYNFRRIDYSLFSDADVEFEAFRAGTIDFRQENSASRWATRYDFPAVRDGRVRREEVENPLRAMGIMQAFVPNLRRDRFKDRRVREALNYAYDFESLNRNLAHNAFSRIDSYFWGTGLASSGLPEGREKEILEELRGKVPDSVFTTPYANPVGGDPYRKRENLRRAVDLLREAGWELRAGRLVNAATGEPFRIEILLFSQSQERTVLPYVSDLRRIGIDARIRTVDASQYTNRVRRFDYDMIYGLWAQSLNPGNEQADYWGSASLTREGSRNYAGIADPAIDELIRKVTFAQDRDELVAATRALDRVLLAHRFVVPMFYSRNVRIAYSSGLAHPAELPYYDLGFPDAWWSKTAEARPVLPGTGQTGANRR